MGNKRGDSRVELFGSIVAKTQLAILFNDGSNQDWLSLSYVGSDDDLDVGNDVTICVPEWAALDKGFV